MKKMVITEVSELEVVVKNVLDILREQKYTGKACVLALHGNLGAGKTTFTQTLARILGVTQIVTSPTFVIMKTYNLTDQPFDQLVHIDAYRIEEIDEMRVLGLTQLLAEKRTIMCIEWAENISELLPNNIITIGFEIEGENRAITISHGNN